MLTLMVGCPGDIGTHKRDSGGNTVNKDSSGIITDTVGWEAGSPKKDTGQADSPPGCPPAPTCNWCNGTAVKDAKGCITGYKCLNGADPCKTSKCAKASCPSGQYCGTDGLCWPYMDSGPPKPDKALPLCLNSKCTATPGKTCLCNWSCSDGTTFKADCKATSGGKYSCTCLTNSKQTKTCTLSATCYQSNLATCCGFAMQ